MLWTILLFLKRLNILVIKDVERDEIEFLSKSFGCKPVANIDAFAEDMRILWRRARSLALKLCELLE